MSYVGPEVDHSITYPAKKYFSDKGEKAIKGNLIYFTRNANAKVERQFDFFVGDESDFEVARLISQSRHSFIAYPVHKPISDHQFWVNQEALRKRNVSFSHWLRMQSKSQTSQRAFTGFSWPLMR